MGVFTVVAALCVIALAACSGYDRSEQPHRYQAGGHCAHPIRRTIVRLFLTTANRRTRNTIPELRPPAHPRAREALPKASGAGRAGSRVDRTWLPPTSKCPVSSCMPQMLTVSGVIESITGTP
jgi:hypothetical protein